MLGADAGALLTRGGKQGTTGKGTCTTKQSTRALMDRRDGFIAEEVLLTPGDLQMMGEVGGHVITLQGLEVSSSHDAGREWARGVEQELVHEGCLAAQDHGQQRAGIEIALSQGMEFGEDFQTHQMGLVDEKQGDLLLGGDVAEGVADNGK